mgnify:CR=1 FL=1
MRINNSKIKVVFDFSPEDYFLVYKVGGEYEWSLNPRIDRIEKEKDDDCGTAKIFLTDEEAEQCKKAGFSFIEYLDYMNEEQKCSCGEPHISDRIRHCYDGKPCFVIESQEENKYEQVDKDLRKKLWDLWFIQEIIDWAQTGSCKGYSFFGGEEEAKKFNGQMKMIQEFLDGEGTIHSEKWENKLEEIKSFLHAQIDKAEEHGRAEIINSKGIVQIVEEAEERGRKKAIRDILREELFNENMTIPENKK